MIWNVIVVTIKISAAFFFFPCVTTMRTAVKLFFVFHVFISDISNAAVNSAKTEGMFGSAGSLHRGHQAAGALR